MAGFLFALVAALLALSAAGCGGDASSAHWNVLFLSNRDGDWALYRMSPNGGHVRRVSPGGKVDPFGDAVGFGNPVVSPDGRRVVVTSRGLVVSTLGTGASRRIGPRDARTVAWSPDGTHVAFSGSNDTGLYIVDVRDGRKAVLFRRWATWSPAWSPDGKWIAFAGRIGDGPMRLYAAHPDGSGLRRLTDYAPAGTGGVAWSRDDRLAVMGMRGNDEQDHLVAVDVRTRHVDVLASRLDGEEVAWSPDGRRIAYAASSVLYTVRADGSDRRRLTPSWPPAAEQSPAWSPDGKSLLFVRVPLGGGAARDVAEVWTMRADGSHRHALTTPYPDGGDNIDPAWVHGSVHTQPRPRPQERRRGDAVVLRVPFAVDGVSAEGDHVAIAPVAYDEQREFQPTPPILLWRPGRAEPVRLGATPCGGVQQLVLARNRLAFDCSQTFFDFVYQAVWTVDLRTRLPREVFFAHAGPNLAGVYVDNIVGGGRLLAFGSERDGKRGGVRQRTLWRIDGFDSIAVRSRPGTGDVVAADDGRMAAALPGGRVAMLGTDGRVLRVLPVVHHPAPSVALAGFDARRRFLLAGRTLLVLQARTLRAYDTADGKLRFERPVPHGAQLEAADKRLVVYAVGSSLHVLSPRHERVVQTGARELRRLRYLVQGLVHAALTPSGLYYCFNVPDRRYPGRVVFVPRRTLVPSG